MSYVDGAIEDAMSDRIVTPREQHCIHVEATANVVRICASWMGPVKPRTPCPPLTPEMLEIADRLARTALQAEPGQVRRSMEGRVYVYRLAPDPSVVLV